MFLNDKIDIKVLEQFYKLFKVLDKDFTKEKQTIDNTEDENKELTKENTTNIFQKQQEEIKKTTLKFQKQQNITEDGIIGPQTLYYMQFPFAQDLNLSLQTINLNTKINPLSYYNKYHSKNSYFDFVLRQDAAESFINLQSKLSKLGILLTSSGSLRSFNSNYNSAHQSPSSFHYPALAIDLNIVSGFFDPENDPYIITNSKKCIDHNNQVKNQNNSVHFEYDFTIWAKVNYLNTVDITQSNLNKYKKNLDNVIYWDSWNSQVDKHTSLNNVYVVNLTELFESNGFKPISPNSSFTCKDNRNYLGSDWWHFQYTNKLIPNFSLFQTEMLKLQKYSSTFLSSVNPTLWNSNNSKIYQYNWF